MLLKETERLLLVRVQPFPINSLIANLQMVRARASEICLCLCALAYTILYCVCCANTELSSGRGWQEHLCLILLARKTNM